MSGACPEPQAALSGQIITWLLVLAGWLAVHWMTARRARRQEELAIVGAIEKRITALRTTAVTYYTSSPSEGDKASEASLKLELRSIVRSIGLLSNRHANHYNVDGEIIALRQVLTGANFESGSRVALAPDDEKIQEIWGRSDDLSAGLQEAFERVHRHF